MPGGIADFNIHQYSSKVLDDIGICLNKAVVFLDDASAELIHWHGAATMLLNYGVSDIHEFSSFEVTWRFMARKRNIYNICVDG